MLHQGRIQGGAKGAMAPPPPPGGGGAPGGGAPRGGVWSLQKWPLKIFLMCLRSAQVPSESLLEHLIFKIFLGEAP